ncbi:MAG: HAD-IA family hydrolase [Anaerolineae bacterium]|nr:HAD-IA family hydrolase [Anaerolineae bacterium]
MIEAVVFDFGGVLVRTVSWERRLAWDARLGMVPGTVEHLVFNSEHGQAAQCGAVRATEHWAWVAAELGLSAESLSQLQTDFWAGDQLDDVLIAFICRQKQLRKTAIISNAMDDLRVDLAHKWGIADAFNLIVISAEFGVMKPDSAIYRHTLDQLEIAPQAAIFIDDFAHNVAGAQAVGMHAIHYTPQLDLYAALAAHKIV